MTDTFGNTNSSFSPVPTAQPISPISVSGLQDPISPINIPTQPGIDTHTATNASIPTPIPSTQDVIDQNTQPTATQGTQSGLLSKIADIMRGKTSLDTLKTQEEKNAGVYDQQGSLNELNNQLEGLTNQSLALQNDAGAGGTIENKGQQLAGKQLMTSGGLKPLTVAELRKNQIQQAGIASQALTLKSAIYASTNNLNLAKAAADRAAQVKFDAQEQMVNYYKSLIDVIQPQLDKDKSAQAAKLSADLAQRTSDLNYKRENFKTGQAAIADALKNNPNNPQAAAAATQAANLDPNDPKYLLSVQSLVAPFATDVTMRALDTQLKRGQLAQQPLDIALKQSQIRASNIQAQLNLQQLKNISDVSSGNVQDFTQTTTNGGKFINTDSISDAKVKAAVQNAARKQGITIVDKAAAGKLQAIDDTRTNLANITNSFNQFAYPNAATRDTVGLFGLGKTIKDIFQTDSNISSFKSWRTAAINSIQALAGGQGSGLRINQAEINAATQNDIPNITDTMEVGKQKIANLTAQLNSWESEMLKPTVGQAAAQSSGMMTSPDGKQQVNLSDLTPDQIKEAKNAGWR